jgi:hypothetical protein
MKRKEKKIFKIIGITTTNEIIGVDCYFSYSDGDCDCGYVGTGFDPISKESVKHMNTLSYAKEFVRDCFQPDYIREHFGSIDKAARLLLTEIDGEYIGQDNSYLFDYKSGLDKVKKDWVELFGYVPETFNCCGGGRMFGKSAHITPKTKWAKLYEPELLKEIFKTEAA